MNDPDTALLERLESHLVTIQYLLIALYYQGDQAKERADKQFQKAVERLLETQ